MTPSWTQLLPALSPTARRGHALVYDPIRNQLVMYGGYDGANILQETWVYDFAAANWIQKFPVLSPPTLWGHTMVWDHVNSRVLLFAGCDIAETAATRACIAKDHEGCRAALPALPDIRAGGLLADRVEILLANQRSQLAVARAARWWDLEPRRLASSEPGYILTKDGLDIHPTRVGAGASATHAAT